MQLDLLVLNLKVAKMKVAEIKIRGSPDKITVSNIKKAIKPMLLGNRRRWLLTKPPYDPNPKPWDWQWARYYMKDGWDLTIRNLEYILGYTSYGNFNTYLMKDADYLYKYRTTKLSTIMEHLKTDINSINIVIHDADTR